MLSNFFLKVSKRFRKLRLQPIRVFCLHHVCEQFDEQAMYPCDWMAIDEFKQKIIALRHKGFRFLSLSEAHQHLKNDWFRSRKYAVLTFDDGYKSLLEILPWLEQQQIPATLFINGKYLDGKSYRDTAKEQYLTKDELFALSGSHIEIAHHGWEHISASQMSKEEFIQSVIKNVEILSSHPLYVPFWAYTYGNYTEQTDSILTTYQITPVKLSGNTNLQNTTAVQRESIFYIDEHIKNTITCRNKGICKTCIYNY